ncbi:MAG: glycoside hydrolase family 2 TIM barrel-domain containing protein, partial [Desulfobacterales bacterium]|nr:glycoside hydrolase family 2 TIM barrel-domain containing protein [Desulfobacterales bacterium]
RFFPDYPGKGEEFGWQKPGAEDPSWDTVEVPHLWNLEPRYEYTGAAWYRHTFRAPELKAGQHARILFGAVFYKSKVWLNGTLLGEHEGGYTAFEFDATAVLKPGAENVLVVRADNSWSTETIPGSRVGGTPRDLTYPWWNYGGIKKPVYLEVSAPVYVANQKIVATPDLAAGTASVSVKVWLRNTTGTAQQRRVRVRVRRPGSWDAAGAAETTLSVAARTTGVAEVTIPLKAGHVALWDFDHPNLYESLVEVIGDGAPTDNQMVRFGIRKLEIRGAKLLLNGESVSFGGANRSADHPKVGSMETPQLIDQDLSMMKTANMGLARILHYPSSPA